MKPLARLGSDPWFVAAAGAALLAVAVMGVWHGLRAGVAMVTYHQAKYGAASGDVTRNLRLCQRVYPLYPWNYRFSIFVAEQAYYDHSATGERRRQLLRQARLWCERGLTQNEWKSQLRRLKTRFLYDEAPLKAVQYWQAFADWQFWEPYNHVVLVEMHARNGDFNKAEAEMKWVTGSSHEASARTFIDRERQSWAEALK